MVLDECLAHPCRGGGGAAVDGSGRCAGRAARASGCSSSATGRCHGVADDESRAGAVRHRAGQCVTRSCARRARAEPSAIGFEAYAIGGLSVGEPTEVMYDIVSTDDRPACRRTAPRYLMGAGTPADLVESVARGVDMFDCVLPTRNARNGQLFTSEGRLNIKNARYAEDDRPPIRPAGATPAGPFHGPICGTFYMAGEINASTLNTLHNLNFYLDTLRRIRDAIVFGRFESFRREFHQSLSRQLTTNDDVRRRSRVRHGRDCRRRKPVACRSIPFVLILGDLLFRHPAPGEEKAAEGAGVSRQPEGKRPDRHDQRHLRPDHAHQRRQGAAADCRQGPDRCRRRRPSAAIRASRRSSTPRIRRNAP